MQILLNTLIRLAAGFFDHRVGLRLALDFILNSRISVVMEVHAGQVQDRGPDEDVHKTLTDPRRNGDINLATQQHFDGDKTERTKEVQRKTDQRAGARSSE